LESALARPRHAFTYGESDFCTLAALYAHGIVRNHPFVDGNKRTAFLAALVFLGRNGLTIVASEDEVTAQVTDLAANTIDESAFADWLRSVTTAS